MVGRFAMRSVPSMLLAVLACFHYPISALPRAIKPPSKASFEQANKRTLQVDSSTYFGAIIGQSRGTTMTDIFVSIGTSQAYVHETTQFSSMSVAFTAAILSVEVHVPGLSGSIDMAASFVVFTGATDATFSTGHIATVILADVDAEVDYGSTHTYIQVMPSFPTVMFDADAVVLLHGGALSKEMSVYTSGSGVRALTLAFTVEELNAYVTITPISSVSTFTNPMTRKVSFGVFTGEMLVPTQTAIARLSFSPAMEISSFDAPSSLVEDFHYEARRVIIIDGGESFPKASDPCSTCKLYLKPQVGFVAAAYVELPEPCVGASGSCTFADDIAIHTCEVNPCEHCTGLTASGNYYAWDNVEVFGNDPPSCKPSTADPAACEAGYGGQDYTCAIESGTQSGTQSSVSCTPADSGAAGGGACYVALPSTSPSPPPSPNDSSPLPSTSPSPPLQRSAPSLPPSTSPSPPPSASPSPPLSTPSPPPSASPSPPPSLSPSPPPSTTSNASDYDAYPGCSASDLQGDFNGNGFSSAYMRVHV